MRTTSRILVALSATALFMNPATAGAQTAADSAAIRRAVLDYVEGFYEGDSVKLSRSIRPEVYKLGFGRNRDSVRYNSVSQMAWQQFLTYAANVKANNRQAPASAPRVVTLLDVLDQTASAKLTAFWGTDYLLLGRFDGRWMISHVLWQSPAPAPRAQDR